MSFWKRLIGIAPTALATVQVIPELVELTKNLNDAIRKGNVEDAARIGFELTAEGERQAQKVRRGG